MSRDTASLTEARTEDLGETLAQIAAVARPAAESAAGAPDSGAVGHASTWIAQLFAEAAASQRPWLKPHVAASPTGEVVFEWWYGAKTLTVYVTDHSAEYVLAWGNDIHEAMSDGDAEPPTTCRRLWVSLTSQ